MQRFLALFDAHVGFENRKGRLHSLHDERAIASMLAFAADFKPHHLILGGDMLDCGPISHHKKGNVGELEQLRLLKDAKVLSESIIRPLESVSLPGRRVYHIGNHERFLDDISDEWPGLEGLLNVEHLLGLSSKWEVIPLGEVSKLGKLHFIHGDQCRSTAHPAKWAVEAYERSIRLGHFHTYAAYSKISALDHTGHTGIVVPALCKRDPKFMGKGPNRWMSGFLYGYVDEKRGYFTDHVVTMVRGTFMALGKAYGQRG